jgi:hypothetical protein
VTLGVTLALGLAAMCDAHAQPPARGRAPVRRAAAPTTWDTLVQRAFESDAFAILEGPRPALGTTRAAGGPAARAAESASGFPAPAGGPPDVPAGDGFKWSGLVSADTLTDEIKDIKSVLVAACSKPGDFKGGGYEKARKGFSAIALAFAVIAAYDQDVRWQKDATTARDLFARAGFNCKVGTDQSYAEAKLRLDDLLALLDGNPPEAKAEGDTDFLWSQVAARPALMSRLEEAEAAIRPAIASKADFGTHLDQFMHAVEIVAVIGEVVIKPDYEYHDDETYVEYAVEMRDAAVAARAAADKKDYEAARAAIGRLEKSCSTCHGDYRS